MKIIRVLNTNAVVSMDSCSQEIIITGAGIGFKKKKGEELDKSRVEKIYCLKSAEDNYRLQQVVREISEKYLEAIMKKLVEEGLVSGLRGKRGGYRLTREADAYSVGDILRAAEDSLAPVACLEKDAEQCPRQHRCATLPMWRELGRLIDGYFDGITLEQLVEQAREIEGGEELV